jgi:hypothetical protein
MSLWWALRVFKAPRSSALYTAPHGYKINSALEGRARPAGDTIYRRMTGLLKAMTFAVVWNGTVDGDTVFRAVRSHHRPAMK